MNELRRPRALRVALVMGGSVVAERTLDAPRAVTLGGGDESSLPLPESSVALTLVLQPPVPSCQSVGWTRVSGASRVLQPVPSWQLVG